MHIESINISHIRSIDAATWNIQAKPGWNVLIGDNGSGKSTFLQAVSLTLIGKENAEALRQDWSTWLYEGKGEAFVSLKFDHNSADDHWAGKGRILENSYCSVRCRIKQDADKMEFTSHTLPGSPSPKRHIWSGKSGWFSAAFGPFRRFTGGNKDTEKLFYSHPQLARHLSIFGEDVALSECIGWLQKLKFKELENSTQQRNFLDELTTFVNQDGFLPHSVKLKEINSEEVKFTDANGFSIPITALSDGFRSILSFTFELLRQLSITYGTYNLFREKDDTIFVNRSGIVLVDEIDAHLHPTWQRVIGYWLTKHFPKIQFIVSTHSPLVCQAAESGSIFRLATPGSEQASGEAKGLERDRLVFGSVLDAYGTELFGKDISRSRSSQEKQEKLAKLNTKALQERLTPKEKEEQENLQALFPSKM